MTGKDPILFKVINEWIEEPTDLKTNEEDFIIIIFIINLFDLGIKHSSTYLQNMTN